MRRRSIEEGRRVKEEGDTNFLKIRDLKFGKQV